MNHTKQSSLAMLSRITMLLAIAISAGGGPRMGSAASETLAQAVTEQVLSQQEAIASQQRIDTLAADSADLLSAYRKMSRRIEDLRIYNAQMATLIDDQSTELTSLKHQLANVEPSKTHLVPLLSRMTEVLKEFIELDAPFLNEERHRRITALNKLEGQADLSLAEKYRRIMEAYQIEAEYGRTIEAYTGKIEQSGQTRTVDLLRIGRVGLYYATFDGQQSGYWDHLAQSWKPLDSDYNQDIVKALRVARKQAPAALLRLPVGAPTSATTSASPDMPSSDPRSSGSPP